MEWMDPQDGSGNAGPADRSCRHRGVDTEVQRAEAALGGDRLVLRAPGPRATEGQRGGQTEYRGWPCALQVSGLPVEQETSQCHKLPVMAPVRLQMCI